MELIPLAATVAAVTKKTITSHPSTNCCLVPEELKSRNERDRGMNKRDEQSGYKGGDIDSNSSLHLSSDGLISEE